MELSSLAQVSIEMKLWLLFVVSFWFVTSFLHYTEQVYFYQLKEYRWDRFREFLFGTDGRETLKSYTFLIRPFVIWGAYLSYVFGFAESLIWPISLVLLLDFVLLVKRYKQKGLRRPKFTIKALLLVLLSQALEVLIAIYAWAYRWVVILFAIRPLTSSAVTTFSRIPTQILKRLAFFRARKKISRYKKMRVIAITGSYGKTTTKEFLSQVLKGKFKVEFTPKNINSDLGISNYILKTDFSGVDVFVVEIGAYKVGDIKLMTDVVRPEIGILTAINEQHLSLFGSIENIQKTKYEVLRAVPKDGLAVTCSDIDLCREFLNEIKAKVETFGLDDQYNPDFFIKAIEDKQKYFDANYKGETYHIEAPFMADYVALNIAPAFIVAKYLGMTPKEILEQLKGLHLPEGVMNTYNFGSAKVIDDSYNSNPNGFKAALDELSKFSSDYKRVVVTRGMLELADKSDEKHEEIAGAISYMADELILISRDFEEPIRRGLVPKFNTNLRVIDDQEELKRYLLELSNTRSVILLENVIPPAVYNAIKEKMTSEKS